MANLKVLLIDYLPKRVFESALQITWNNIFLDLRQQQRHIADSFKQRQQRAERPAVFVLCNYFLGLLLYHLMEWNDSQFVVAFAMLFEVAALTDNSPQNHKADAPRDGRIAHDSRSKRFIM